MQNYKQLNHLQRYEVMKLFESEETHHKDLDNVAEEVAW